MSGGTEAEECRATGEEAAEVEEHGRSQKARKKKRYKCKENLQHILPPAVRSSLSFFNTDPCRCLTINLTNCRYDSGKDSCKVRVVTQTVGVGMVSICTACNRSWHGMVSICTACYI